MKHYRYQSKITYDEFAPPKVSIELIEFDSIKETRAGYWIIESIYMRYYTRGINHIKKRFVLKNSRKRFAYPTKDEAMNSFKIRANKRVSYLKRDLSNAELIIKKLEHEQI
jgi:hypothetical protein